MVWQPLLSQEPLLAQTEFIEICSRDDYQTLEKRLNQHSKSAVQVWLTEPVIGQDCPLHACARRGCTEVVKLLLANGADPNLAKDNGATPLHVAAENGHQAVVGLLLGRQADPNLAFSDGVTPLSIAAQNGYQVVVELLLANGVDPNRASDDGATPLYVAAHNGHQAVVELLLDRQANPNLTRRSDGATALYVAARNGHQAVVELLLDRQANPNLTRRSDGATPLYVAARNGHQAVVKLLLDRQVNPNLTRRSDGATPLYVAAQNGHQAVVELLLVLANGADPNLAKDTGTTPLYTAAFRGHQAIVELLLANGADPNLTHRSDGATPLYVAAQNGHQAVVELLLANGADPNRSRYYGATPLHVAAQNGHTAVVVILLGVGPVSSVDFNADTPLHDAVRGHHPVVVVLLLQAGVNPGLQNTAGLTALSVLNRQARPFTPCQQAIAELLRGKNRHRLVRWLQRWLRHQNTYGEHTLHEVIRLGGAGSIPTHCNDLETPRLDGCTPLHLAVLHGNKAVVAELVIQGVNLSPLDLQNETPLQLALQSGHESIINILGPAVITVGDGATNEVSQGRSVDKSLLSELPVFSLQNWAANALRRWLTLDKVRALFESGVLPLRLSVLVLGAPDHRAEHQ